MIDEIEAGKTYLDEKGEKVVTTAVGEKTFLYKYTGKPAEWSSTIDFGLKRWNEIERETITLTEYVCVGSVTEWLTPDFKYIDFCRNQNILNPVNYPEKCHKAPNARSYKVYADTLEPVKE